MTWNEGKGDQAGKADRKQADTLFPDEFGDSPFPGQGCLWSSLLTVLADEAQSVETAGRIGGRILGS